MSVRLMPTIITSLDIHSYTFVCLNYASIIYQGLMLLFWPTAVPALSCRSSRFSPLLMTFSRFCRAIPDTCGMTCHYALLLFMHTHTHLHTCTHTSTHHHTCMHACTHTHTHTQTYLISFLLHVSQPVCLLGLPATNTENLISTPS